MDAQEVLADVYSFGEGVARDPARAFELYSQAALQGSAHGHYNVGCALDERGDLDGAEAAYRAAVAAEPGDPSAHNNLGTMLRLVRGDVDGAEVAYRAAVAADPGYAKAHNNLGLLLQVERNDLVGAEAAYRAAIAAEPGYAAAYDCLGSVLKDIGNDLVGAEAAYRAAIALEPENASALSNLGILLEANARAMEQRLWVLDTLWSNIVDLHHVVTLYDECAQLWGASKGEDHEWTEAARADAARVSTLL